MNAPVHPAFVGEDRHRLLAELTDSYARVQRAGRNRLVVLAAPTGWGKTRVVQELYARLVEEAGGGYWPGRLGGTEGSWLHARKRTFPESFEVADEATIPFLWLGVSCQKDQMGRELAALQYAEQQFQAHVGPMAAALAGRGDRWKARLGAVGAVAGLFGLPDPVNLAMTWHGVATSAWEMASGEWQSFRDRRAGQAARRIDVHAEGQSVDRALELAEQVALLSGEDLPVVIVVDDAHWADAGTVSFIGKLLTTPGSVLVVATAWPDQLAVQTDETGTFGHALEGWLFADWAERHELDQLQDDALREIVMGVAEEADGRLLEALCKKADGNPNRLQGLMSLRVVRRALAAGGPELTPEQIDELPTGDQEIYAAIWRDLPERVREVLAVSTVQGPEFNPEWIPAAAELLELADADTGLSEARSPWGWVRSLDAALDAFVEAGLYERAEEESRTLFLPDELARARAAMLNWAVEQKGRDDWQELSVAARRAVLEAHYRGADDGFLVIDESVMDSINRLLTHLDDSHELNRLREVAERGIAWAAGIPEAIHYYWRFRQRQADAVGEMGRIEEAIELFRSMVRDHSREHGEQHFDTYYLRRGLATYLAEAGRLQEAVSEFHDILREWTNRYGTTHAVTQSVRQRLANAYKALGRLDEATAEYETLRDERIEGLGPDHPDTLSARFNLAECRGHAGHISKALAELRELLVDRERLLGEDHPVNLNVRNSIGRWLIDAGKPEEALKHLQTLAEDDLRVFGPDHPDTLVTRSNIANSLLEMRRYGEAVEAFQKLLADRIRILGPDHPLTLGTRSNLAVALGRADRDDESVEEQRRLLDDRHRVLGPDHPDTLVSRHNLATSLGEAGDYDEAIIQLELVLEDRTRVLGEENPLTVLSLGNLAYCYWHGGRKPDAGPMLERVLECRREMLGEDHPDTFVARHNLGSWRIDDAADREDIGDARAGLSELGSVIADQRRVLGDDHRMTRDTEALYEEVVGELRGADWFPQACLPNGAASETRRTETR